MNQEPESQAAAPADRESELSVRDAAGLLHETTSRARRQFEVWPPYLLVCGAVIFLGAYGVVWWSVRTQTPYVGPSGAALGVMYAAIALWIVLSTVVIRRATRGVSGPSVTSRAYRGSYLVVIAAYSLFQGALYHAGASHAIVYGIFPACAPWLFAGTIFVALGVAREESRSLLLGSSLIAIGIAGAFAGARWGWFVSGVSIAVVLGALAVSQAVNRSSR